MNNNKEREREELHKTIWRIANDLRGAMNADDFRDYMLSFLFLRYLSFNYEEAAKYRNRLYNLNELETQDFTYLSNARQINMIKKCLSLSEEIKKQNEKNTPVDLIQIDIQRLWEKLGELTGESYKDELLDEIFSKFCLGK